MVLRGAGRAFCAGLDIAGNSADGFLQTTDESFRSQRRISEIVVRMRRIPQPIVALIHGPTCGGGLALALGADVRLCANNLKTNVAMASIGLSGNDIGISYLLPRIVGLSMASEMILTANFIGAVRAEKCGLVSAAYPTIEELDKAGMQMARDMLKLGLMGLELSKHGLNHSLAASSLESQVALEDRQQIMVSYDGEFKKRILEFNGKKGKAKM